MTGQPGISAAIDRVISALAGLADALEQDAAPAEFLERHPRPGDHRTLAGQDAAQANPYGPSVPLARLRDREHYEGPDNSYHDDRPPCLAGYGASAYVCLAAKGHSGDHMAYGGRNPDGSYKVHYRWPQDAASPAGVAEGVDTTCTRIRPDNGIYRCKRQGGHDGSHEDITGHQWADRGAEPCDASWDTEGSRHPCLLPGGHKGPHKNGMATWTASPPGSAYLCPAQWGDPADPMHCGQPSGHTGNHATSEPVIEWAGKWETAEPGDGAA